MKSDIPSIIGRTGTVLVFHEGSEVKAVVSWVIARAKRCHRRPSLKISGNVHPDQQGLRHLNRVVLPLVNYIATALGLPHHSFELSFVQLGIASSLQRPLTLAGHSIDLPVFLAMLSAVLKLALPQDVVCTGHIGSMDGDVRMVASVEAKLGAVLTGPGFRRFVFPHPDADASLRVLAPAQRQQLIDALAAASERLQLFGVRSVRDLLLAVLEEEPLVLAALRSGYFHLEAQTLQDSDLPLTPAAAFLCWQNGQRFWLILERHLFAGRHSASHRLLSAFVRCHVRKKQYPTDFGLKLKQLRDSLPPAVRGLKLKWPLIAVDQCVELARFAGPSDAQDVQFLFQAINVGGAQVIAAPVVTSPREASDEARSDDAAVDALLEQIRPRAVAQRINPPIHSARAAFTSALTVESSGELIDAVSRLYLMFLRHCGEASASTDPQSCRDDAVRVLESAFASEGGFRAALAEARWPASGLPSVIDAFTERYKRERQTIFVERAIKEAIPADWIERVRFTKAVLRKMDLELPEELRDLPPDRLANSIAEIIQAHVHSMEHVNRLLRSL